MLAGTTNLWLIALPDVPGGVGAFPAVERKPMHLPCQGRSGVCGPGGPSVEIAEATLLGATAQPSSVHDSKSAFWSAGGPSWKVNEVPPAPIVPVCTSCVFVGVSTLPKKSNCVTERSNGSPGFPTTSARYAPAAGPAITTVRNPSDCRYVDPGISLTTPEPARPVRRPCGSVTSTSAGGSAISASGV